MIVSGLDYVKIPLEFRGKYKYLVRTPIVVFVGIRYNVHTEWFSLTRDGFLTIKQGYRWDGCTGMIDTSTNMLAGLVHDCLYQMMRESYLPFKLREKVDRVFQSLLEDCGSWYLTQKIAYWVVRNFGAKHATPKES